jgi:hypothetical protein
LLYVTCNIYQAKISLISYTVNFRAKQIKWAVVEWTHVA